MKPLEEFDFAQAPQIPAARLDALFEAWLYGDKLPDLPAAHGAQSGTSGA